MSAGCPFTPESGHMQCTNLCLPCAKSGNRAAYSITSVTRAKECLRHWSRTPAASLQPVRASPPLAATNGGTPSQSMSVACSDDEVTPPRPTVRAMTSTQGGLSFVKLDCKQASILPPPGSTPAHNELTSPRHSFASAAAPSSTAWHGRVRSARCELRQALIPPGATSPHAALISAAHSLAICPCCAIVYVVESNTVAPIAKIIFCIGCPPDVLTNCMQ